MNRYVKYAGGSIVLVVIQSTIMHFVNLEGIVPDLLTIWIVYIALMEGQFEATMWGFAIGLLFDLTTHDFIGLSALSKTICGFIAGYFYGENKARLVLTSYRFLLIVFFVSIIQNIVYFVVFTQGSEIGLGRAIFEFGLTTTLYTAIVSLLPIFIFTRRPAFS
ncbi:MAG TPA: rod shape-determining protein MreD, partial [Bacteroidota bacterium]|nr:rod shape-determining protein MreD [Bacteroidota bacterium]